MIVLDKVSFMSTFLPKIIYYLVNKNHNLKHLSLVSLCN